MLPKVAYVRVELAEAELVLLLHRLQLPPQLVLLLLQHLQYIADLHYILADF